MVHIEASSFVILYSKQIRKNLRSLLANDKVGPGNSKDLDTQIWSHF